MFGGPPLVRTRVHQHPGLLRVRLPVRIQQNRGEVLRRGRVRRAAGKDPPVAIVMKHASHLYLSTISIFLSEFCSSLPIHSVYYVVGISDIGNKKAKSAQINKASSNQDSGFEMHAGSISDQTQHQASFELVRRRQFSQLRLGGLAGQMIFFLPFLHSLVVEAELTEVPYMGYLPSP